MTRQPDPAARPAVFVLFGATGDLARRMVLPALYRLACEGLLPRRWLLVGNEDADSIVIFRIDAATGQLTPTGASVSVPVPVCVRFLAKGQ